MTNIAWSTFHKNLLSYYNDYNSDDGNFYLSKSTIFDEISDEEFEQLFKESSDLDPFNLDSMLQSEITEVGYLFGATTEGSLDYKTLSTRVLRAIRLQYVLTNLLHPSEKEESETECN